MEFLNNLIEAVKASPKISEDNKKQLYEVVYKLQDLEIEATGAGLMRVMLIQKESIKLGDKFETNYYDYGGDVATLNKYKRQELDRKVDEAKKILPKVPNSIKKFMKVK